jgi:hypothetical protein
MTASCALEGQQRVDSRRLGPEGAAVLTRRVDKSSYLVPPRPHGPGQERAFKLVPR